MTIGERIRSIRGLLSQDEFASRLSVSKAAVGAYERNVSIPGSTFIISICEHFNVRFEWLLLGAGPVHLGDDLSTEESQCKNQVATNVMCPRCTKLETELEMEKTERRGLSNENRELSVENRQCAAKIEQLLRENGDLRERCARLEEKQACGNFG